MEEKAIKKIVKDAIVPYIKGLRNEIEDGNATLKEILEAQKKNLKLDYDLEIDSKDFIGDPGVTPVADKDYPSILSIQNFIIKNLPKKGKDYFNAKDVKEIVTAVYKKIRIPKDGEVDYSKVKELAKPLFDEHVKNIKVGLKKVEKEIFEHIKEATQDKISAREIVKLLESLKGSSRLDAKAIKGLEKFVQTVIIAGGGSPSGGGATGGGSSVASFLDLTDTPSSYTGEGLKFTRVKATEDGIEFVTLGSVLTSILADVAFTGDYNDLDNLPSIPSAYTDEMARDAVGNGFNSSLIYSDSGDSFGINLDHGNTWNARETFDTITGAEKINNPGFATDTVWTKTTGWAITGGVATHNANGTGTLSQASGSMITPLVVGETYILTFTIKNYVSGSVTPACGGNLSAFSARSANGTYTETFTAQSTASLTFSPTNTSRFDLDDISLKKISGGGVLATNSRSASLNYPTQESAPVAWNASGWKSNAVAGSQSAYFEAIVKAITGAGAITAEWTLRRSLNGGSFADLLTIRDTGQSTQTVQSGVLFANELIFNQGNSNPNTTSAFKLSNAGQNTWINMFFGGTLRASIGADSNGALKLFQSGGSGVEFYAGNSGLSSNTLYSYNYATAFVHTGYGEFGSGVHAGSQSQPTSTLQNQGGTALKVKRATANLTLDNTATHWLLDATSASSCAGTPSTTTCSSYTGSGQATCESHLPCSWNPGNSCSAFNNESGMGSCSGTSGCSVDTTSCAGPGDQSTCEAQDDAYGGSCTWNSGTDCGGISDESTCNSTGGCASNYSGCTWDGISVCYGNALCDVIFDQGTCEATTYFTNCTGTYGIGCEGTYNNGNCSGTYGQACNGTVLCSAYGSSGPCAGESGCSWSAVLNAELPDGETCPDRTYWICNDSSGGADVVLIPYSGQKINDATSYTLSAYKDCIHIAYYKKTADCVSLDESTCGSTTGCSQYYIDCASFGYEGSCVADAHCSWNGSSCDGGTYFSSCGGTYTLLKNWYKFSD